MRINKRDKDGNIYPHLHHINILYKDYTSVLGHKRSNQFAAETTLSDLHRIKNFFISALNTPYDRNLLKFWNLSPQYGIDFSQIFKSIIFHKFDPGNLSNKNIALLDRNLPGFNVCYIQNPNDRGAYNITSMRDDIVFSRYPGFDNKSEEVYTPNTLLCTNGLHYSREVNEVSENEYLYLPRFYGKEYGLRARTTYMQKLVSISDSYKTRVGIYLRPGVDPEQYNEVVKIMGSLNESMKEDLQLYILGNANVEDFRSQGIDTIQTNDERLFISCIESYVHFPTTIHDPFPNTAFNAVLNDIPLSIVYYKDNQINIGKTIEKETKSDGMDDLKTFFCDISYTNKRMFKTWDRSNFLHHSGAWSLSYGRTTYQDRARYLMKASRVNIAREILERALRQILVGYDEVQLFILFRNLEGLIIELFGATKSVEWASKRGYFMTGRRYNHKDKNYYKPYQPKPNPTKTNPK